MNTTAHPVAPEEVMALLDGEISAAEAPAISTHIDGCSECGALVAQFRRTSLSLSRWNVEAVPAEFENRITDLAAIACSGHEIGKASPFIRASFWTWKQWALGLGAAAAIFILVVATSTPRLMRTKRVVSPSVAAPRYRTESGANSVGSEAIDQAEKAFPNPSRTAAAWGSIRTLRGASDREALSAAAPMIARSVSLSIVVKDFAASRSVLDGILARHHGYPAQLMVSTPENAARNLQTSLRIPAPELPSAVADLKNLGRVENESQTGEEVTPQHTDLAARLKNSRETEERLRSMLQERTGKVTDVLEVEEQIAQVRGDIERMEAQQQALEHRVDFATVELQLSEEYQAQLHPPAASVSTRIHNASVAGYRNAAETVLGIVLFFAEYGPALLIWLVILLLPVILVWRRYRKMLTTM